MDQTNFADLKQVLMAAPPAYQRKRTFFDISKTARKEVVISQWYRYYLDPREDHGLRSLFLEALLSLCDRKLTLREFTVRTERKTEDKKGIDILVSGIGPDEGKYLIIENKIHHEVNNPLRQYWDHCKGHPESRIGVLLTLKTETVPADVRGLFQNILHHQWIKAVQARIGKYNLSPEQKYHYDHFTAAITNLCRFASMTEQVAFYIRNTEAVNRLRDFRKDALAYIVYQVDEAFRRLGLAEKETPTSFLHRQRGYLLPGMEEYLSYVVVFDKLLEPEHSLRIVLGLGPKSINRFEELETVFRDKVARTSLQLSAFKGVGFHNILTGTYVLNEAAWADMASFVERRVKEEFSELAAEMGSYLKENQAQPINPTTAI